MPSGSTNRDFLNKFTNASKGKAIASQAEEIGVAISRGFNARHELVRGMGAAVIALGGVLVHGHSSSRCLSHIQRRTVAAEHFDR